MHTQDLKSNKKKGHSNSNKKKKLENLQNQVFEPTGELKSQGKSGLLNQKGDKPFQKAINHINYFSFLIYF